MQKPAPLRHHYQAATRLADEPVVVYQDHIVSPIECTHIIELATGKMNRAKVSLDTESVETAGRSGSNCWLDYKDDPTLQAIGQRIANIVGIPLDHAEHMQVIHYGPDQEYRAHYDAYNLKSERGKRCCKFGGQRMLTALVYLNAVEEGGETAFPKLDVAVTPNQGRLIIFHNVDDDSTQPHDRSLHAGMPVGKGEKWAFNMWFHAISMKEEFDFTALEQPAIAEQSSTGGLAIRSNRAKPVVARALQLMDPDLLNPAEPACLTWWDLYDREPPDLSALPANCRIIKLIDRAVMNPLSNKGKLPILLADKGISHLAPPTYHSIDAALAHDGPPVTMWFVKNKYGTGGKDMKCIRHDDLSGFHLDQHFVIQAAVPDLELWQGRKYTTRIYALIHDRQFYLYDNGFVMVHGPQFDPQSTDHAVQIDHGGYEKADGAVDVYPLQTHPNYATWIPRLQDFAKNLKPVFADAMQASDKDNYALLGIDLLLQQNGGIQLLEINTAANFVHSKHVNDEVNVPFFKAVFETLLGRTHKSLS